MPSNAFDSPPVPAEFGVFGVNHRTAPLHVRERLAIGPLEIPALLRTALRDGLLTEGVILSTCNRVELYGSFPLGCEASGRIEQVFGALKGIAPRDLGDVAYVHVGRPMVEHLFRVACGLDSLILGEAQILGQVRDAFAGAAAAGSTGPLFNRLFHQALRVGKLARAESSIAAGATSLASVAVRMLAERLGGLRGRSGVLLGAGAMAGLAAAHLRGRGLADVVVANRTLSRAEELAATCDGRAARLDTLVKEVLGADFVLAACSAPELLLHRQSLARSWGGRSGRPLTAVDLSVPRVIDPGIVSLPGVILWDLDALNDVLRADAARRESAVRWVEELIAHEVEEFCRWRQERESVGPSLAALTGRCEAIRREAVERNLKFLDQSDPQQIARFSQSLVAKLIDRPLRQIRTWNPETPEGQFRLEVTRELFGLEEEGEGWAQQTLYQPLHSGEAFGLRAGR